MSKETLVFKQRQREIENSLLTVQKSIDFWEVELDKILQEIEKSEDEPWHPEKDSIQESLYKKCRTWIKRGEIEKNQMSLLESEMDELENDMINHLTSHTKKAPKKVRININLKS